MARLKRPTVDELNAIWERLTRAIADHDVEAIRAEGIEVEPYPGGHFEFGVSEVINAYVKNDKSELVRMLCLIAWYVKAAKQYPRERWVLSVYESLAHEKKIYDQRPGVAKTTCRGSGCNHCCHMQVLISDVEAGLMLEAVERGGFLDWEQLARQQPVADIDNEKFYHQPKELRRCPFLTPKGACGIYENRPMSCRTHYSLVEPELCDIDLAGGNVTIAHLFLHHNAAMVTAAVVSERLEFGTMARMLGNALAAQGGAGGGPG